MKKVLVLLAFVFAAGMVSGQKCSKAEKAACAKTGKTCVKKSSTASTTDSETKVASAMSVADIAADADENIVKKVCDYSGTVSFYKKEVTDDSGKVSMTEVEFDEESNTFVNASPSEVMNDKEAKAVQASDNGKKKACCAGKKSCASKKKGA